MSDGPAEHPFVHSDGLQASLLVLRRRWRLVLATFVAATVAAIVFTRVAKPDYEVTSGIVVLFGRENVFRPEVGGYAASSVDWVQVVNSELEILRSRDLVEQVVRQLGPATLYPDAVRDAPDEETAVGIAVSSFTRALDIQSVRQSSILRVAYEHQDPRLAVRAVNDLVEAYKVKHLEVLSDPKTDFLEHELGEQERRLAEAEADLDGYRREFSLHDLPEQRLLLLQRRSALEAAQREALVRVAELQQQLDSVSRRVEVDATQVSLPPGFAAYKPVEDARARLMELRLKESELRGKYTETSRVMTALRDQIREAETLLRESVDQIAAQVRAGYEDEIASRRRGIEGVSRQLDDLDDEIAGLDERERQLVQRARAVDVREASYKAQLGKLDDARITAELDRRNIASVRVFEKATLPVKPAGIPKNVRIVLGSMLGLCAGIALAFLRELLQETFGV